MIGAHIVDFCCEQARLVIELDGGQHESSEVDLVRTASLEAAGYFVLRFWNNDVIENTEGVLEEIAPALRLSSGA